MCDLSHFFLVQRSLALDSDSDLGLSWRPSEALPDSVIPGVIQVVLILYFFNFFF